MFTSILHHPVARARRARLIQRQADDPLPCRSDAHPDGLPNLPQALLSRVQAASHLYRVTAAALVFAAGLGKFVSCENPRSSFMWQTSFWKDALGNLPLRHSVFDRCQYGGSRPKKTLLLHNVPSFDKLCLQCPGESSDHQHLPWGRISRFRYATSEETAYPLPLCRTMAQLLLCELTEKGYRPPPRSLADPLLHLHHAAQVSVGAQPRGKRVPPMVSEFKTIVSVDCNHDFLSRGARLEAPLPLPLDATCDQAVSLLPAGSRVLQRLHLGADESTASLETPKSVQPLSLNPHPRQPPDAAEKHAAACLSKSVLSENDISELFVLLKSEKTARGSGFSR